METKTTSSVVNAKSPLRGAILHSTLVSISRILSARKKSQTGRSFICHTDYSADQAALANLARHKRFARLSVLRFYEGQFLDSLGTLNFVTTSGGQNWRTTLHRGKDLFVAVPPCDGSIPCGTPSLSLGTFL